MLDSLLDTIARAYRPDRHFDLLKALWREERWFDTPRQLRAAEIARDVLAEAGLAQVEFSPYPADGRARFQDWITRMAWDCPSARLTIAGEAGAVLADRESCPQATVMWSGPLGSGAEPVTAPVVDANALDELTAETVGGKFVLTAGESHEMKRRLAGTGALAVVSDKVREGSGYDENTTFWTNDWADGPGGWYVHADDSGLTGFNLSAAAGRRLRERLGADPDLKLTGFCESRVYEGVGQNVTAVLPGEDETREIWIFGHACEQGASDNCSGVSIIIESLRMLKELIEAGRLGRPRCSIRLITTEECLGMLAFATVRSELAGRALAGLNVDAVGAVTLPERPERLSFGPLSSPTIGWPVAGLIARTLVDRSGGAYHVRCKNAVPAADDMIADPKCGIPSLWLGQAGEATGYHSGADTPEVCTGESMRNNALLTATWAYAMAAMDDRLAASLVGPARGWMDEFVIRDEAGDAAHLQRWAAAGVLRDLARWSVSESVYEPAASAYSPAGAPPLPDLPTDGVRYVRTVWGTCTFETLPPERRKGFSRWGGSQNSPLYWTDGKRPLAAVERLAAAELRKEEKPDRADLFEACVEAGIARKLS